MAITKITDKSLADNAVTVDSLGDNLEFQGEYVKIPTITTTARNALSPSAGYIVFNTTTATMEQYDGSSWTEMSKPPIISTLSYSGSATAVDPAGGETITISGSNFKSGVNVRFGQTYATSVTRTNSTSLSVVVPALTAGDYNVIVENGDGMQATLTNGLTSNAAPVFTTASGSLGSIYNDSAITTITLVATETDGGAITYNVTTGALPTGLSLSGADIDGTPTGYTAETTANFTITATDDEGQTTTRNFSLTVLVSFYDYTIDQSLRFNDGDTAYLSRTPSSAGNRRTWTWSGWVKRSEIGTGTSNRNVLFEAKDSGDYWTYFGFFDDALQMYSVFSPTDYGVKTSRLFRDVSAWYHIVVIWDTTEATASDRFKLYVNGEQVTLNDVYGLLPSNYEGHINRASIVHNIGKNTDQGVNFDGYMAEVNFIDGQALDPTYFGETKEGVWIPKAYSGSYGTNGFYLDFDGTYYNDKSGNGNNFTANNLSATDVVLDSPTNNFATLNPLDNKEYSGGINLKEGNLFQESNSDATLFSNIGFNSGKWYAEFLCINASNSRSIGIVDSSFYSGFFAHPNIGHSSQYAYRTYNEGTGDLYAGTTLQATNVGKAGTGDILQVYVDLDSATKTIKFKRNNSDLVGTTSMDISQTGIDWVFGMNCGDTQDMVANFGQDSSFAGNTTAQGNQDSNGIGDFYYTPPSGYLALCNENLPNDDTFELLTGEQPSDHFNTVLYTGNGSTQSITGVGFQPDFTWIKRRSTTGSHALIDSNRGEDKFLESNGTGAEATFASNNFTFTSDGYDLDYTGGYNNINQSGVNYVAWNWKAGGTPVSNTDGSITSSVSANTAAGFSIVNFTGTGTNGTVGHGLSQAPEMMIFKRRDGDTNWLIYHADIGTGYNLFLNLTNAKDTDGALYWQSTSPTSTVFTAGGYAQLNYSGSDTIGYCFHSVDGFSKFGSYTGNGSTDGPFIYTGFKPGFIMVKQTDAARNWQILDNVRDVDNPVTNHIHPNLSNAEANAGAAGWYDSLSNGFKIRATYNEMNISGATYIYMAIAEDPFKYGNSR